MVSSEGTHGKVLDGERMCVQLCIAPNPDAGKSAARQGYPIPHVLNI